MHPNEPWLDAVRETNEEAHMRDWSAVREFMRLSTFKPTTAERWLQ
jgi:hypothetical protein